MCGLLFFIQARRKVIRLGPRAPYTSWIRSIIVSPRLTILITPLPVLTFAATFSCMTAFTGLGPFPWAVDCSGAFMSAAEEIGSRSCLLKTARGEGPSMKAPATHKPAVTAAAVTSLTSLKIHRRPPSIFDDFQGYSGVDTRFLIGIAGGQGIITKDVDGPGYASGLLHENLQGRFPENAGIGCPGF